MCPPHPEPPSVPTPSFLVVREHFGSPASHIRLTLAVCLTCDINVAMLSSQIIPPSPSPESKRLFFTSVSPLLPCTQNRQNRILSVHDNIGCLFFFLPDFTL